MKIALLTDSTCDWHLPDYAEKNVVMMPLHIQVGEKTFLDQVELSSERYYDYLEADDEELATSQPAPGEFIEQFERLASEGYDAVVCMHIAPTLSGTCSSAQLAAKSVDNIDVRVIDSLGASCQLGLLVDQAVRLREEGMDVDQMVAQLNEYATRSRLFFAAETLDRLAKGGRFPAAQAEQAKLLNIRVVFELGDDGSVGLLERTKGLKGVIAYETELLAKHIEKYGPCRVRIMQVRAQKGVDKLIASFDEAGLDYELISIDSTGATVACHTGLGCLGFGVMPKSLN